MGDFVFLQISGKLHAAPAYCKQLQYMSSIHRTNNHVSLAALQVLYTTLNILLKSKLSSWWHVY